MGGASSYNSGGIFTSKSFGVNAEFESKTHAGAEIVGQYRATYLAKLHGLPFPVVVTAFRDVASDGRVFYDVQNNGLGPIKSYFLFMLAASFGCVAVFELADLAKKRKKQVADSRQSTNV